MVEGSSPFAGAFYHPHPSTTHINQPSLIIIVQHVPFVEPTLPDLLHRYVRHDRTVVLVSHLRYHLFAEGVVLRLAHRRYHPHLALPILYLADLPQTGCDLLFGLLL